ncbi:MAG: alpha/beta fold hydrolase [Rhodospirillales bacterium]|nr:alpha/beta fold hydrolase [Rhodospirillales bacterium]
MSDSMRLDGPRQRPASGTAKQLVVLLHGWGANGDDLIGLAPYLAGGLPDAAFVSPNAPYPCEANPMGRQWFGLTGRSEPQMLAGLKLAASLVDAFLDEELERQGVGPDRLALVGFSQGTMLSLHVGLRRRARLAQIVGFSGALLGAETLGGEIETKPPVLLVHGTGDPVVPAQASQAAAEALKAQQVSVELLLRPNLPHSIDEQGIAAASAALRKAFGVAG